MNPSSPNAGSNAAAPAPTLGDVLGPENAAPAPPAPDTGDAAAPPGPSGNYDNLIVHGTYTGGGPSLELQLLNQRLDQQLANNQQRLNAYTTDRSVEENTAFMAGVYREDTNYSLGRATDPTLQRLQNQDFNNPANIIGTPIQDEGLESLGNGIADIALAGVGGLALLTPAGQAAALAYGIADAPRALAEGDPLALLAFSGLGGEISAARGIAGDLARVDEVEEIGGGVLRTASAAETEPASLRALEQSETLESSAARSEATLESAESAGSQRFEQDAGQIEALETVGGAAPEARVAAQAVAVAAPANETAYAVHAGEEVEAAIGAEDAQAATNSSASGEITPVRFGANGEVYAKLPAPSNPGVLRWQRMNPDGISNRDAYMGSNPGRDSSIGLQVQGRMRDAGALVGDGSGRQVLGADGNWYPINQTDMGHIQAAVDYWNAQGRYYGPLSPEVRGFMNDPLNYWLEPSSINRSNGALMGRTYLPPATAQEQADFFGIDDIE